MVEVERIAGIDDRRGVDSVHGHNKFPLRAVWCGGRIALRDSAVAEQHSMLSPIAWSTLDAVRLEIRGCLWRFDIEVEMDLSIG
jgi:hypothetical protein